MCCRCASCPRPRSLQLALMASHSYSRQTPKVDGESQAIGAGCAHDMSHASSKQHHRSALSASSSVVALVDPPHALHLVRCHPPPPPFLQVTVSAHQSHICSQVLDRERAQQHRCCRCCTHRACAVSEHKQALNGVPTCAQLAPFPSG